MDGFSAQPAMVGVKFGGSESLGVWARFGMGFSEDLEILL